MFEIEGASGGREADFRTCPHPPVSRVTLKQILTLIRLKKKLTNLVLPGPPTSLFLKKF